ncbi:MAG: class I SAM-dependent methyltransferase [Lysobacterales bacterium]
MTPMQCKFSLGLFSPLLLAAVLTGCSAGDEPAAPASTEIAPSEKPPQTATRVDAPTSSGLSLSEVLASQPDKAKARFDARNPEQTLQFFGIEPGMTVVEALPGGGWYSKILIPYLGEEGRLIGVNYSAEMWPLFGFFGEEQIEGFKVWTETWPVQAEAWRGDGGASLGAYEFGKVPDSAAGTVDAVLMVRALHNLSRFESQGGFLSSAVSDVHKLLKVGGVVGVVQHEAPADWPQEWAQGGQGYLKKAELIALMTAAGFELEAESDVNANPRDVPGEGDVVWRLPPSYNGTSDDPELKAEVDAIGESNRMTLKFRKT